MKNLYYKVDQSHFYVFYIAAAAGTDNVVIPIVSQLQTHPPKLNKTTQKTSTTNSLTYLPNVHQTLVIYLSLIALPPPSAKSHKTAQLR